MGLGFGGLEGIVWRAAIGMGWILAEGGAWGFCRLGMEHGGSSDAGW